jgi:hypothetical protein
MNIEKYSIGIGDRFGRAGAAQMRAVRSAEALGTVVVPVWNKSFREHSLIGTRPDDVRAEADAAVRGAEWRHPYHVDADHIGLKTVDAFVDASDFFTLDVADFIGHAAPDAAIATFVSDMRSLRKTVNLRGVGAPLEVTDAMLERVGRQYLHAVLEASKTYRHVAERRGSRDFIAEVSVDEAAEPQQPWELFFILGALARADVPVQTIAPKFSGKFLKGIDYVGDVDVFAREFEAHLEVVEQAIAVFGLPPSLKLSVHTGSDKFSLYPAMRSALKKHGAGLHLKTAGTTWLEEVIGVALSGASGFRVVARVYREAVGRFDELCKPYATVVEIDRSRLPSPAAVEEGTAEQFVRLLRHDRGCQDYSVDVRQLMHVAFKVAAEMGDEYRDALGSAAQTADRCVTDNLFERHIRPLFIDA